MLENRYNPRGLLKAQEEIRDKYYELKPKQQSLLGDNYLDDLNDIFDDYRKVWSGTERPRETEREFKIQIAKYKGIPVLFHGIIDEVYEDAIGEHKTFNQRPDLSILTMNTQSMLYAKAFQELFGHMPKKIKWDYIKSTPADWPIWLEKSKKFSEAQSTKITPYSWSRACKSRGINDWEIIDKGQKYADNIPNFFFRHEVDVIPEMVDTVWDSFKMAVKDIITKGHLNRIMNITRDCSWCNYRPICYARFTGGDVEHVKNADFQIKKK